MKLPLSWLAEFVTLEADVDELCRRLTLAGLEVENVERAAPGFIGEFSNSALPRAVDARW